MRAGLAAGAPTNEGEGSRALAFFHALLLAGVVLIPMASTVDLKRPLACLWAALGLGWLALRPTAFIAPPKRLLLGLGVFLAAWLLAWAFSSSKSYAAARLENQALFAAVAGLAACLPGRLRLAQARALLWTALVLLAVALAGELGFLAFFRDLGGSGSLDWRFLAVLAVFGNGREQSSFGNPLFYAAFSLAAIPVAWALGKPKAAPFLLAWGGLMSGSRSYALVAGLLYGGLWCRSRWKASADPRRWLTLALPLAFVAYALWRIDWTRSTLRWPLWKAVGNWAFGSPLLGHGPGSFAPAFQATLGGPLAEAFYRGNEYAEHPHNWALFLLSEGGLLLLGAFVFLLAVVARQLRSALKDADGPAARFDLAAGLGALGFLLHNLFDRSLEVPGVAFFFWMLLGWTAAPLAKGEGKAQPPQVWLRSLAFAASVGLLTLAASSAMQAIGLRQAPDGLPPKVAESEAFLRDRLKEEPRNVWAWESLGAQLASKQRFADAAQAFAQALALSPTSRSAALNLGNSRFMLSDYSRAEAAYRAALALDPSYAEAHYDLGACLFYQRRLKEAVAELDLALKLDPGHARAKALKAQLLQ